MTVMITETSKNFNLFNILLLIATIALYNFFSIWLLDLLFAKYWGYFIAIFMSIGMLGFIIPGIFTIPYSLIIQGKPKYNLKASIVILILSLTSVIIYFNIFRFDLTKIMMFFLIMTFSNTLLIIRLNDSL